jgi:hypothetical protein
MPACRTWQNLSNMGGKAGYPPVAVVDFFGSCIYRNDEGVQTSLTKALDERRGKKGAVGYQEAL